MPDGEGRRAYDVTRNGGLEVCNGVGAARVEKRNAMSCMDVSYHETVVARQLARRGLSA